MNRNKLIESRDARRDRVVYWAEHYRRELGVPQVVFTTTARAWEANGGGHIPSRITGRAYLDGKLVYTSRIRPAGRARYLVGGTDLQRSAALAPLCWINISKPINDRRIENTVLHEILHAVYHIDDGPVFERMLRVSRCHPRTRRNLDRLARAALQMQTGLISLSPRAD